MSSWGAAQHAPGIFPCPGARVDPLLERVRQLLRLIVEKLQQLSVTETPGTVSRIAVNSKTAGLPIDVSRM